MNDPVVSVRAELSRSADGEPLLVEEYEQRPNAAESPGDVLAEVPLFQECQMGDGAACEEGVELVLERLDADERVEVVLTLEPHVHFYSATCAHDPPQAPAVSVEWTQ